MSRFPAPLRLALLIMLTLAVSLPLVPGCEATEAGQSTAATAADSNTANLAETIPTVASATAQADGSSFQNVILLIGDGMGTQHVELGRLVKGKPMVFDDWPVRGLLDTAPHRAGIITDSAAAATAMATGMRTANGRISIGPDGERLSTIMQRFQQKGARVGLVATKSITDATPAAFVANVNSRREEAAIARQMLAAQPDVLLGGGWSYIGLSLGAISGQPAQNAATQAGYQLVRSVDQLKAFDPQKSPRLLGVFATLHMDYMVDRTADTSQPTLAEMTAAALSVVGRDGRPFFLMIEGSQIDSAGHENDAWRLAGEMLAFDEAVATVINWADKRNAWKNTLVIVVADHETGGLTMTPDAQGGITPEDLARQTTWSTAGHTSAPVPIFARGAGSEAATQARHLVDLYSLMSRSTLLSDVPEIIQVDSPQNSPAQEEPLEAAPQPAILKPAA